MTIAMDLKFLKNKINTDFKVAFSTRSPFSFLTRISPKSIGLFLSSFLFFVLLACSTPDKKNQTSGTKGHYETELDYQKFIDPPVQFRSFPFYSINDQLDPKEIKRQILDFKQAGFGGFYLHSRAGLLTEFLGKEWWEVMDAAVEAANEAGLQACFYDEDKWPSGYAGGIIPKMSENYRAKCLARLDKATPVPPGSILLKEDEQYKYISYTAQMGEPKFNGTCWVDLFNPEMVQKFIEVSYQPYIEKYKAKTNHYTFSIFADEPHIHARYFDNNTPNKGVLSYSPWVRKKFKSLYGYDFTDKIDLLFEEKENWREVRLQYYRAVAQQFEESFTRQIAQYCEKNGVKFTGHFLGEDVLKKVRDRIGNSMLHYRNMQQPGIDNLGLTISGRLITARSLSSVANQYGIPRRMSELFGISGQNMNFEDRKWIAGWHAIMGINHYCPHLTLYSLKGGRKRDYPPTFSYHQPYWTSNKQIEDYMGRISYATTIGQYDPQILVLNPLESEYAKGNQDQEFSSGIMKLMENLQAVHYDYDLGDEQIMADTARVKGDQLVIGAMRYSTVILPDMITIRPSTLDLLTKLIQNGGKVINVGRFPEYVDGQESNARLSALKEAAIQIRMEELKETLPKLVQPQVEITGNQADKIWSQIRKVKGGHLIQLSNVSHTETICFNLKSPLLQKQLVLWDPSKAKCYDLKPDDKGMFTLELPSSSNVWITSGSLSQSAQTDGIYQLPVKQVKELVLDGKWEGQRLSPNAITLDFARYSIDQGKTFSEPEPVIGIYNRLSDKKYKGELMLDYPVQIDQVPTQCKLVVEQPAMYHQVTVNSAPVDFDKNDFYLDHSFPTAKISQLLKKGKNTIRLSLSFKPEIPDSESSLERYGTEIESIYLTGDFAVKGYHPSEVMNSQRNLSGDFQLRPVHGFQSFSISSEKDEFAGNLTLEGYPFYAGAFELKQSFTMDNLKQGSQYFIEFPNCEAIVSKLEINGNEIASLSWTPYKADITKALKPGRNEVKITLVNSLRNLLGPHHQKRAELVRVGPYSFTGAGGFPDPRGDKDWYDLRKTEKELKIWTDTYYQIPFGFLEPVILNRSEK